MDLWPHPLHVSVPPPQATVERYGELKFLLDAATADRVEEAARSLFPAADGGWSGPMTLLCLDTPDFSVARRVRGYRRRRYRVRRAGLGSSLSLERRLRQTDHVRRDRVDVAAGDLERALSPGADPAWPGAWFFREALATGLRPVCRLTFARAAFLDPDPAWAARLTIDRALVGVPEDRWALDPVAPGRDVLEGRALLQMHFGATLPPAMRRLVAEFRLAPRKFSKYRRFARASGLLPPEGVRDA